MRKFLTVLTFAGLALCWASSASAATCFWVGGSATWDTSNTASWASGTGGTPSTCAATGGIPKQSGDVATFDANSTGTITVNANFNLGATGQIIWGNCACVLDFSANNNSITLGLFSGTGTGARTIHMGSGTFTITSSTSTMFTMATQTNLVAFDAGTSVINLTYSGTSSNTINMGTGLTYATVNFALSSTGSVVLSGGSNTYGHMGIAAGTFISFPSGATQTISNAFTWTGTSTIPITVLSATGITTTIAAAAGSTAAWAAFHDMTFTGSPTASNSFNLGGHNTGITITAPTGGGAVTGAYIFGD